MTRTMSPAVLAYSILAGPILWFVHFVAVYSLAEFGCRANFINAAFLTPETIRLLILVITLVIIVAVGAGGVWAYQGWRSFARKGSNDTDSEMREYFLIRVGMMLSGLFLFSIIVTTVPIFFLSTCDLAL